MYFLFLIIVLFIILFVVVNLLIFIHELGHYTVAKKSGVNVPVFMIGFGPKLFSKKLKGTDFVFKLFPLGGYVLTLDSEIISEIDRIKKDLYYHPENRLQVIEEIKPFNLDEEYKLTESLDNLKPTRKIIFALMGVIFNLIALFLVLFFQYVTIGQQIKTDSIGINVASNNSQQFYSANNFEYYSLLDPTQKITASDFTNESNLLYQPFNYVEPTSNGEDTNHHYSLFDSDGNYFLSNNSLTNPVDYTLQANGHQTDIYYQIDVNNVTFTDENIHYYLFYFPITTHFTLTSNQGANYNLNNTYLAISIDELTGEITLPLSRPIIYQDFNRLVIFEYPGFFNSIWQAFIDSFRYLWVAIYQIINLFTFGLLSSPTAMISHFQFANNFLYSYFIILQSFVLFSALTIIFNLLPIPPLDGWKVVEFGYEGVKKQKISKTRLEKLYKIGWGILIFIFIFPVIFLFI